MATLSPWEYKDTLRQMTEKFNLAVASVIALQESTETVNGATSEQLQQIQTTFAVELKAIREDLDTKVSSVTAQDLNLGNVDNTSDLDKPISTATQTALDQLEGEMPTTEEVGAEFNTANLYDPEVTAPVKKYIDDRIDELWAGAWEGQHPTYNIASADKLGVIKSGDVVSVDPTTGKLTIPALSGILDRLETLETNVTNLTESLETNNRATSLAVYNIGIMDQLQTKTKSSLVDAINENNQLIKQSHEE